MGGDTTKCNGSTDHVAQGFSTAIGSAPQNRDSPLRIVIVNNVFDGRDATPDSALDRFTTLTGWADAVQSQGARVLVCQRFHRDAQLTRANVAYRFFAGTDSPRPPSWFRGTHVLHAAVASFEPAVVHVNGMEFPRAIRRLRKSLPAATAIVVQDHGGFDPQRLSRFRRAWLRHGLVAADVLLVATAAQAAAFRNSGLVPASVAMRDVMESSTDLRAKRTGDAAGGPHVLWVGRLNANKDPLTVLEGFARFAQTHSDATLKFVYGSAELESPLRDAIGRLGLGARVKLVGAVPHQALAAIYASADLFVLGSRREGSGYAVLEAMACSVVPVLTDIPSFRGLTDDGRVGELWSAGDPGALADALARAISGAPLASKREASRRRFEDCFSWDAIGARAMAIYCECSVR